MKLQVLNEKQETMTQDWLTVAKSLGKEMAEQAAAVDQEGVFVTQNYALLKAHGLFTAGIPSDLGGGGASYDELCAVIRELSKHCGSTALAFSMHTHPLAVNVFKWRNGDQQAKNILSKIANNNLVIAGTGANDWLASNGEAQKVEGGYKISAHKHFVSGCPGADVFVTSVNFRSDEGEEVLHFSIPFGSEGIRIGDNWDTLGMRGTGSQDVFMKDVFVPEAAIITRRPAGEWHMLWNLILPIAMPIIVSAYVGLAESALNHALESAKGKTFLAPLVGEMHNSLTTACLALEDMVRISDNYGFTPSVETVNKILTRKSLAANAVKATVELAAELVGGPGFFRSHPIERIVRDIRALHFHPLPEKRQQIFSGRIAMGLDPVG